MALSISRRVLRAVGSSDVSFVSTSLCKAFNSYGYGDSLPSLQFSVLGKWTNIIDVNLHPLCLYEDLVIPVTNFSNEDKGFMVLAGDVFDVPIRKDIIHRVVRWQLAKRQQGTHSTKTLSEVSGTGRKPWQQKGTGRARHGTLRDKLNGQQFRGGAAMHGPKPRSHAIKLNKKVRRLGLKIALSARAAEGKAKDLEVPSHKTKNIVNYVHQMENAKKLLLVDGGPINEKLKLATQNIHYVNVLPSIGLNVYSILLHDTLVMSRDAVNKVVERMHTPINR
ncbi:hypothetical protein DH2020_035416 [Rehmannia glutinosa]|uniref:Large ribosomal subunit protein uL4m n=1 Tax=Rehmannia glutinosa TaxID=99300 RepID=A0ABR0V6L5_REHGL